MLLPTLVVVPVSFSSKQSFIFPPKGLSTRWYREFFTDPLWTGAAKASFLIALAVAFLATTLGTMAALAITKSRGRWVAPVKNVLMAPLVVPGTAIAMGIYYVFLRLQLTETYLGLILAHTVMAIPIVLITVSASLNSFDWQMIKASESLGARPAITFAKVTLPLILPGVLAGGLFAFLTSFDEAIVSLFLTGPDLKTLPIQIYMSVTSSFEPTAAAAATLIIVLATGLIATFGVLSYFREKAGTNG